jgi:glycosyltransferase involved in cell wall biosynthesis
MPFYGNPEHFKLAIQSVRSQTDQHWTLTVLDDNYPDTEPGFWLQSLDDPRITYIRNEENLLPSNNYNKAIDLCDSDFFILMGCDDIMLPNFVSHVKQLILEASSSVAIIQPGVEIIDESGLRNSGLADVVKKIISPWPKKGSLEINGKEAHLSLLRGNWTYFPSLIWRREAIGNLRFRADLNVVQDLSMILELLEQGNSLLIDSYPVFQYRRHRLSLSGKTGIDGSKFLQEQVLFSEVAERSKNLGWNKTARVAKIHLFSRLNATTELPRALIAGNKNGIKNLLSHIFAP